ncbi:MAG: DUF2577 domain-containing protein [Anaerotignum sp.]|nr:DUF2577 domain-containing protein [Anaerotignum sp.]
MLEIIKQLALDVAESGADFTVGTVVSAEPLTIRLEEGLELTSEFLIQMENTLEREETGAISINDGSWNSYRMKRDRRLKQGESVALLRAADGQQYLVLERVRKEG